MKSSKKILTSAVALLMAVAMCLMSAGCDIEGISEMAGMMDEFSEFTSNDTYDGPAVSDEDIYTLDIFNDLPDTPSDIDPLFWVAEGNNGGKVYLLGSIHCAEPETYRLPDLLMDAYLESDALAVECDILAYESDFMAQLEMSTQMMYSDGSTIDQHIDPELYDAMIKFYEDNPSQQLSQLGYTADMLKMFKPAMWMSVLEMIIYEASGIDSTLGIDYHFLNIAHAQQKEVIEIESVEFQNDMLFGFSDELMEWQLWGYVSYSVEEQADSLREMFEGWCEGNPEYLVNAEPDYSGYTAEEIEEAQALLEEYYTAMLIDRNLGMVDKAEEMLENGDNVFYVVGAAHMVGNDGIIAGLKDRGWTVTQLGGMDADEYTDINGDYPTLYEVDPDKLHTEDEEDEIIEDEPVEDDPVATTTPEYDYDYDLYLEMYEYFGGTTSPTEPEQEETTATSRTTTSRTTRTTRPTTTRTTSGDGYGGSGVFG
ncbi:MAG: TraB/GumN family protein [Ruminococcaceae bacterium]|nr:TraB/GumN family protein [Oscillospiraceae bacterium]